MFGLLLLGGDESMKHDWSPRKNLALLTEAFWGTREARERHRRSRRLPIDIQSGLSAIRTHWPDLHSPNQTAPIFVFSAGWRSGSTFLQRWIMTAENVMVWGEPYCHAGLIQSLAGQLKAFTRDWPMEEFFPHGDEHALSQAWVANLYPSPPDFMNAHIAFLEKLFLEPARVLGRNRWGLKEVTLAVDHARYLRWLFPNARFLFLCRDPYDAYGSYRKWRSWYRTWPNEPVFTASRYGAVWRELTADFVENHQKVGGLLLRYEELRTQETRVRLEGYLGLQLAKPSSLPHVGATGASADRVNAHSHWIPKLEAFLLKRQVEPTSRQLGYKM
jgi:hypothetical protein